jgi:integrase
MIFLRPSRDPRRPAIPTIALTDLAVKHLKPVEGKRITYLDKSLKGFGVMVTPSGHASYVLTYGPERRRIKLGDVGVVKLADARAQARDRLSRHQLGLEKETGSPTFETARAEFLAASIEKGNKARTTRDYTRLLTRHFFAWNKLRLDELSSHDVQRRIDRIQAGSERRHAYDAVKVFMKWAERRHYLDRALTDRMDAPAKGRSRDRILADDELRAVWLACNGDDHFSRIIRLCILTGQRRSEIAHLERSMIRGDRIAFPSEFSKNRQEHVFPIGPMSRAILAELPTSGYLFPARKTWRGRGSVYNAWNKDKPRLDKRSGVTGWVIHDLRRTFSSNWARLGILVEVTEKYINHVSGRQSGVQGIYNRYTYWEPMERACAAWERFLSDLIAGQRRPVT